MKKLTSFGLSTTLVAASLILLSSVDAAKEDKAITYKERLNPVTSMPLWFYDANENFRYPIPSQFDFAYIDKTGKVVIKGPFVDADHFKNGKARVALGIYGLENNKWVVKTPIIYPARNAEVLKNGRILESNKPYYDSNFLINYQRNFRRHYNGRNIDSAYSLAKDLRNKHTPKNISAFQEAKTELWGYKDESGKVYIKPRFDFEGPFVEGISRIKNNYSVRWKKSLKEYYERHTTALNTFAGDADNEPINIHSSMGNVAYITDRGKLIVSLDRFQNGTDFSEGYAAVKNLGKWGYIDKNGKIAIKLDYEYATKFSSGLAAVCKDGKFGYIDKNNQVVIPFKFADARAFRDGLAPASLDGKHWGYITTHGDFSIKPNFRMAFPFYEDMALVMIPERENIEKDPDELKNFYRSGLTLMRLNKFRQAKKAFQIVQKFDSKSLEGRSSLFVIKYILPEQNYSKVAISMYSNGKIDKKRTQESYIKAIADSPDFAWAKVKLAEFYMSKKENDKAKELLSPLAAKQPQFMPANILLAKLLDNENQHQKAEDIRNRYKGLRQDAQLFREIQRLIPPQYY